MNLIEYPDAEMMMIDLANTLAGEIENVLFTKERASFVVPGGTTPGPIFDSLCAADLDWSRVDVMLSDERWVPESSPRSNTRLVKERLFTGRAATATWVPLYSPADRPEDKIDDLTRAVDACLPISVALLGMGADMHTASLFPGADNLEAALQADAPTLMAMRAEGAGEPRITMTGHVLAGAMSRHIVITGAEKKAALLRAATLNDPVAAPVSALLAGTTVHWAE